MVRHENEFEMMLDQLSRGGRELEAVSIVGMGGIGKTNLTTKLYSDPRIMSRFSIRAKVTVSQEYCLRNVLLGLLSSTSDEPDDQLADQLQKHLKVRRYLVVIDDIWATEAWDDIKLCFQIVIMEAEYSRLLGTWKWLNMLVQVSLLITCAS